MPLSQTIRYTLLSVFIIGGGLASTVQAVEPLSLKELTHLCKNYNAHPQKSESLQCARYIKGFIDGAIAADSGVRSEQAEEEKELSFSERAINTRIGARVKRFADGESSNFCLGNPISIAEVIDTVTKNIKTIKNQDRSALRAMFKILKDNYPCTAE